jgi:hypothetical protein
MASGHNHSGEPEVVRAGDEALRVVPRRPSHGNVVVGRDCDGAARVFVLALHKGEGELDLCGASHGNECSMVVGGGGKDGCWTECAAAGRNTVTGAPSSGTAAPRRQRKSRAQGQKG